MSRYKKIPGSKPVYVPSLIPNITYLINIWYRKANNPNPISGVYLGYGKSENELSDKIPKLNTIFDGNLYFKIDDGIINFPIRKKIPIYNDNGLIRRVTFSYDYEKIGEDVVHLSKGELNRSKFIEVSNKNKERDFKTFEKINFFEDTSSKLKEFVKTKLSNIDDDMFEDFYKSFVEDNTTTIRLKSPLIPSKLYFSFKKYFEYEKVKTEYSKIRNAKRYNLARYLDIKFDVLTFNMEQLSNKENIEDQISSIKLDNIAVYSDDNIIDIDDNIKQILLWIFCVYGNEQVNLLLETYKLYSVIELQI